LAARLGGRYRHVRELGHGAAGRVVEVADDVGGGSRAAKIVAPEHGERLRWELALLTGLGHPNLAGVHELLRIEAPLPAPFALEAGTWVLIEELASGSASSRITRALPDPGSRIALAIALGGACARALAAIHGAGLVHGDVKPDNVVVEPPPGDPRRARLVDLGLAGAPGAGPVRGTPMYLAPEAWLGERSAASDLFALGVTLREWIAPTASGEPESGSATERGEIVPGARPLDRLPEATPEALRALIAELLRERPEERPASAREVARRLATLAGESTDASALLDEPSADERARRCALAPVRGRAREIAAIESALATPGVIVVHGPPGAGRTRAIREAVRATQAARAGAGASVPTWIRGALPSRLSHPAIVHDEIGAIDLRAARAAVRDAELDGVSVVVVLERVESVPETTAIAIGPIDDEALRALLGDLLSMRSPPAALRDAARGASAGLPGRLCRLIADAMASGRDPSRPGILRSLGREESAALAIPESCRALVEALAIAGGTLAREEAAAFAGDALPIARQAALLIGSGIATFEGGGLVLRADRAVAVRGELRAGRRRAAARALDGAAFSPIARACVDAELGRAERACAGFLASAERRRAAGDPAGAAEILALAGERIGPLPDALRIARADALRASGDEREAEAALEGATSREAIALAAELARLGGDDARAEDLAGRVAGDGDDGPAIAGLATRARIAWTRGELDTARALATRACTLAGARIADTARAHEALALVAASAGDHAASARHAEDAERAASRIAIPWQSVAAQARAWSLIGSAALGAQSIERAIAAYERARDLGERAGERVATAGATLNLGLALLDAGRLGPAIATLRDGAGRLIRRGRGRDAGRALFNLANAAFLAGDDPLAELAASRAHEAATEAGDHDARVHAAIVISDLAVRAGRLRAALATLSAVDAKGPISATIAARIAMVHATAGAVSDARAAVERASAIERELGGAHRLGEVAIAEARVALAAGEAPLAETAALRAMHEARTFETRIRAALASADTAEACGHRQESLTRLAQARTWLDAAARELDPAQRAKLRAVPAYQRALGARPEARAAVALAVETDRPSGRAVLALARRVTAEHRPARVLEALARAALELCGAERAFVLARAVDGAIDVRCGLDLAGPLGPEHRPSRSIAARVIDERRAMVSVDAIDDARLDRAASVHALALRSVLAVPVQTRDGGALALYVDDRLRPGAFDDALAGDLASLAELGAAALVNAERWRDERRLARHHARRERRLELALDARGEELRSIRREIHGDPFAALVATSDAMRAVIALASRVAASGLPVLLLGESGTGKEAIARAIHAASARKDRAFVAEGCGAIPEGLLESTLFGHVRGAFTGAERARRGLFEIADGGTLFLDAVAETSAAMQAKLLRVLEEGEIRAVGSERTREIDVRVIAAASPDLRARIESGAFRADLFYRLAVVTIELPPLRERPGDIAPLATFFVARHAAERRVGIEREALDALRAYPWPGNVRQLENEIRRALLIAEGAIGVADLSPEVRAATSGDVERERGDELDLKSQIDSLERRLVERALAVHAGNQTRAARALGLSRFGLQKMIKRFERSE
jgi:serine/threonine-protein kinase PknK